MYAERRWRPRAIRYLVSILVLIATVGTFAGVRSATGSALAPDLQTSFSSRIAPSRLPARGAAPVRLTLAEKIGTLSGAQPPALQKLDLNFDRNLGLSVKGLPKCTSPFGGRQSRTETLVKCEDARIGSGTIEVEVTFPGKQPFPTTGRISVYNGGANASRTIFWIYALIQAPASEVVLVPLEVNRDSDGPYGWNGELELPKIASDYASVTSLGLRLRKGIFSAACPSGKLRGRATAQFAGGTSAARPFVQRCSTAGSG
jgi:hypothetical protein